jgi:hypothetical protein
MGVIRGIVNREFGNLALIEDPLSLHSVHVQSFHKEVFQPCASLNFKKRF